MSSVAERLTQAREKAGYTILNAADLTGVPHIELGRYEAGDAELDPLDLRRLCVVYGCSMEWVMGRARY